MAFSSALALSDLNDFLGPSQECIKPVSVVEEPNVKEKDVGAAATEIMIDASHTYYEISPETSTSAAGGRKLKKAEITLNDCLACSGCVTSAESVLVAMQSHEEVYKMLEERPDLTPILSFSPQSIASLAAIYNLSPASCLRRLRQAFRDRLGFRFVFDTTFARHLSLVEGRHEFYEKAPSYKGKERATSPSPKSFPLLASACPGWICYAEKTHGELLPYISNVKSPQQVMGSLVKEWLGPKLGLTRDQIYHVSVMPCYDKKLEASRPDFATESGNRDVDCVLTTGEVQRILNEKGIDVTSMLDISEPEAQEMVFPSLLSGRGSASGGYLHNIIIAAIKGQPQSTLASLVLDIRHIRGEDYVEYILRSGASVVFRGAKCYGFRNLQNVVRKVGREAGITVSKGAAGRSIVTKPPGLSKRMTRVPGEGREGDSRELERGYDFIEVMACPSGCVNGGGQISPPKHPLPIEIDSEGMPIIASDAGEYKVVADPQGHRVLSGKDWVARVEEFYWRLGATKIMEQGSANLPSVHDSIRPYLESLVEETTRNQFAEKILGEMTSGHANPDEERQRILRTQYRAIESEEVNGLAVKW